MAGTRTGDAPSPTDALPLDEFKEAGRGLARAMMMRALTSANGRIRDLTGRLNESTGNGESAGAKMFEAGAGELAKGRSPLRAGVTAGVTGAKEKVKDVAGAGGEKVKDVAGLGGAKEKVKDVAGLVGGGEGDGGDAGGGEKEAKVVTIIEEFDVGLPLRTTYDQWTRFGDYPSFTSKVESVEQESDEKINWRAQIFLSHRSWESTIVEQVPDTRIVWKSTGAKGYVDGAVTFAELTPNLTRVLLVAEYHPDGFFEKTANLWRAQGRRLRLEFKHIKRHMMTRAVLERDEIEGWRGEIRDGEVVKTHEDAVKEEQDSVKEEQGAAKEEQGAVKEEQDARRDDAG
ncbi:SRPBCC family protein [Actinomadura sp. WMMB 499]|uniref:SRPBCC family protein n=1 Tax=Actinomadura sp. WMMB 499 TaxID=1219491 RepID=UPI001247F8DA|nr:SRPBCC family protein [Actinomadura sp. WMMB 499]QFG25327.1 SRPBCC family protein [Actinomadura sp. WMMB 499]